MIVVLQLAKLFVLIFSKMLRPDFIVIPLRFKRDDDSSTTAGYQKKFFITSRLSINQLTNIPINQP